MNIRMNACNLFTSPGVWGCCETPETSLHAFLAIRKYDVTIDIKQIVM